MSRVPQTGAIAFEDAARCLAELGHPRRLQIFRLLIKAGESGLSVGEIQSELRIPKSTLAHHIAQLVSAGLMTQAREGRIQRCRVDAVRGRDHTGRNLRVGEGMVAFGDPASDLQID